MSTWFWVVFNLFVVAMLLIDLKVFNREAHEIKLKEALIWSAVWIGVSILFGIGLYIWMGREIGLMFFTGYLIEKSLSVDNLFVFLLIFSYFQVPANLQHRVLFWGIMGAIILRAIFIFAGVALLEAFSWMIYVFGVFLVYTSIKMLRSDEKDYDPSSNPVLKLFTRYFPISDEFAGENFFIRKGGQLMATPLFIVLLVIETSDVIFAVDSIPAILSVTQDTFLVYSSNILAILGLRALYFALAGIMDMFHYLRYGLAFILGFVGVKMLVSGFWHLPTALALGVIAGVLILSIVASVIWPETKAANQLAVNSQQIEASSEQ